jgi:hypothetical protein
LEAQVELLTDGQREAGDFAVAGHRGLRERSIALFACGAMIARMRQDVKPTGGFEQALRVAHELGMFVAAGAPLAERGRGWCSQARDRPFGE